MHTKQTIAIIGLGETGATMAWLLSKSKERVLLFDKDVTSASTLANELVAANSSFEVEAITCSKDACWEADIIIPSVAYNELECVVSYISQYATQKIVVNFYPSGNEEGASITRSLQALLPYSKVVSAVYKASLPLAKALDTQPVEVTVDGDNAEAVETISELLSTLGFAVTANTW